MVGVHFQIKTHLSSINVFSRGFLICHIRNFNHNSHLTVTVPTKHMTSNDEGKRGDSKGRRTVETVCTNCNTDIMHWVHFAAAGAII